MIYAFAILFFPVMLLSALGVFFSRNFMVMAICAALFFAYWAGLEALA